MTLFHQNTTVTQQLPPMAQAEINRVFRWWGPRGSGCRSSENETHLVGTIRKNRRNIPKEVANDKLKTGEYIARESEDGITIMKWKDKRDVLVLSTIHSDRFQTIIKRGKTVSKPKIVLDCNRAKGAVDLSHV